MYLINVFDQIKNANIFRQKYNFWTSYAFFLKLGLHAVHIWSYFS
jgi:hypothetical protein